jgi:hypothetical protein
VAWTARDPAPNVVVGVTGIKEEGDVTAGTVPKIDAGPEYTSAVDPSGRRGWVGNFGSFVLVAGMVAGIPGTLPNITGPVSGAVDDSLPNGDCSGLAT